MLNFIHGVKNTDMKMQVISIDTTEDSEINFEDFEVVANSIVQAVNKYDTVNPYNTYNFDMIEMDIDSDLDDKAEYSVEGVIYLKIEDDSHTTYGFSVISEDAFDLDEAIESALLKVFNVESAEELDKILITNAAFTITKIED